MFYKKYIPHKSIRKFVECFNAWEGEAIETLQIESPPSALCAIVFNLKEPYQWSNQRYELQKYPGILFVDKK